MKLVTFFLPVSLVVGLLVLTCTPSFSAGKVHTKTVRHTQITTGKVHTKPLRHTQVVKNVRQKIAVREMHKYKEQLAHRTIKNQSVTTRPLRSGARISIKNVAQKPSDFYFWDDMENGVGGWTIDTQLDTLWHLTTGNYSSPTHSWWVGNENIGTYANGSRVDQSLVSPAIDLTSIPPPLSLSFVENYVTEPGKDLCMVDVTTDDGASWTALRTGMSGNSGGWILSSLDLSPFAGQSIKFRFHFDTGDSLYNDFPGWYIDDVVIVDYPGTIDGTVFLDLNQDGSYNGNDFGLGGWTISASGGGIAETTVTDQDGYYRFVLPYGTYSITEDLQPGWTQTAPPSGSWTIDITTPSQYFGSQNFGNWHPGVNLAGFVFADDNRNGVQDNGEVLFPKQPIYIEGGDNLWISDEVNTDSTGHFSYTVFDTGTYSISQDFDNIDGFQSWPVNGQPYTIHVGSLSDNIPVLTFGTIYPSRSPWIITGYVFADDNQNGDRDSGEVLLPNQYIEISGGYNYTIDDEVKTDSTGHFTDAVIDTGIYYISQDIDENNSTQTLPADGNGYTIRIGLLPDTIRDIDFGTFFPSRVPCSISGKVFNDVNDNGIQDPWEDGIADAYVELGGDEEDEYLTGSDGAYRFDDLPPGHYTVSVNLDEDGWWQAFPISGYDFNFLTKTDIDTANFAEIVIGKTASITGNVFNDINRNGVKDPGEKGIRFWTISLTGSTQHGCHVGANTVSDTNGNYAFYSLWPGNYNVVEQLRSMWVQTFPANFNPWTVSLGPESTKTDINFGNHQDSTISEGYRSFIPEDLALTRDYQGKLKWTPIKKLYPTQVTFWSAFVNNDKSLKIATTLHLEFKLPLVDTLTITPWGIQSFLRPNIVNISFPEGLNHGDSVYISGVGNESALGKKDLQMVNTAMWTFLDNSKSSTRACYLRSVFSAYEPPNAVDVLIAMTGNSIQVGSVTARSVIHKNYTYIGKSLNYKNTTHTGLPTCLGYYQPGHIIYKQLTSLPPKYPIASNKLFAEAIALQVNLLASDRNITPPGFGDLIYDEGGQNPLNGKSIRSIADVLNEYMSSNDYVPGRHDLSGTTHCHIPAGYEGLDSLKLWQTIRNIDSAFDAPIAINYWISGSIPNISLTPVRSITDVSYLHIDTSFGQTGKMRPVAVNPIPKRFDLLQNYPNPFNPTTTIQFSLPEAAYVTVKIYNILGQEVFTLINRQAFDPGSQIVDFDASGLASGVYLYRIVAERVDDHGAATGRSFIQVKKMVLLK